MATPVKTTKVFVGNLSFKTTADELKAAFETVGKVANANIITRGSRSLGYGFVDFNSDEDANKAVTEMNKKKLTIGKSMWKSLSLATSQNLPLPHQEEEATVEEEVTEEVDMVYEEEEEVIDEEIWGVMVDADLVLQ